MASSLHPKARRRYSVPSCAAAPAAPERRARKRPKPAMSLRPSTTMVTTMGKRHPARPDGRQQAGYAKRGLRIEGERVHEIVVDPAINDIDLDRALVVRIHT